MSILQHFFLLGLLLFLSTTVSAQNRPSLQAQERESYIVVLKKNSAATASAEMAFTANSTVSAHSVVATLLSRVAAKHKLHQPERVFSRVLRGGVYHMTIKMKRVIPTKTKLYRWLRQ